MTKLTSLLVVFCFVAAASGGCCVNRHFSGAGPCASGACHHACTPCGALKQCMTCGSGCGEIYCDEWISDPPDYCDPCDPCTGDWIGPQWCSPQSHCLNFLAFLRGYRYQGDCCQPGSCCGHGHGHVEGGYVEGEYVEGEVIENAPGEIIDPGIPTPAIPEETAQQIKKNSKYTGRSTRSVVRNNR